MLLLLIIIYFILCNYFLYSNVVPALTKGCGSSNILCSLSNVFSVKDTFQLYFAFQLYLAVTKYDITAEKPRG